MICFVQMHWQCPLQGAELLENFRIKLFKQLPCNTGKILNGFLLRGNVSKLWMETVGVCFWKNPCAEQEPAGTSLFPPGRLLGVLGRRTSVEGSPLVQGKPRLAAGHARTHVLEN